MDPVPPYMKVGAIPPKRHIKFDNPKGGIYREEVFGTEGFDGVSSILYHIHAPLRFSKVGKTQDVKPAAWATDHRHHHVRTQKTASGGDPQAARRVVMFNDNCALEVAAPTADAPEDRFFRNATADELWFAHEGSGELHSVFGKVSYRKGDYIHIPRGTTYRFKGAARSRFFIVTTFGALTFPRRYVNQSGQFMEHAPYCERDLHGPTEPIALDKAGAFQVTVRVDWDETTYTLDRHPFDVVGWDGCNYPFTFNVSDFEPITGRIHQPPPVHETFCGPGFMVGSFVPRKLDYHPLSIPAPYYHANIDADEILYYVAGDFTSRKGVGVGDITLHRRGLHHGPQPGRYEGSIGAKETDEVAIMVESQGHFTLTEHCRDIDDGQYMGSWVKE